MNRFAFALFLVTALLVPVTMRDGGLDARPAARGSFLGPVTGFVENAGQWDADVRFAARFEDVDLAVGEDCVGMTLSGRDRVRMQFEGAHSPRFEGVDDTGARCHFFVGDEKRWATHVRVFAATVAHEMYPGVDVVFRRGGGSRFEYDFVLAPDADIESIVCRLDGAHALRVDPVDGALEFETEHGTVRQPRPTSWVDAPDGSRAPVECDFVLLDERRLGFEAEPVAAGRLTIDPQIQWFTYFGGAALDRGYSVVTTSDGAIVTGGNSASADTPTTTGAFDESFNGVGANPFTVGDYYVARFDAEGQLEFATFLGGTDNDSLSAIRLAPGGDVIVAGWSRSTDFPVTAGAYDTTHNGNGPPQLIGGDVCVSRLSADGSSLVYSTFVGGADTEWPNSLAIGANGEVTVAGHTHSLQYPVTPGAYKTAMHPIGHSDLFITRLDPTGSSLVFSTLFGGDGEEYALALELDDQNGVVFAGATDSTDLDTTPGAFDETFNGGPGLYADAYVAGIDATGSTLTFCTYLGGPGDERAEALAFEPDGSMTVVGETRAPGFPVTPGAYDETHNGGRDLFVTRLSADGTQVAWSTMLGGALDEYARGIEAIGGGRVVAVGYTGSDDYPLTEGAFDTVRGPNGDDVCLSELSADGSTLLASSFLGGDWDERVESSALHPSGDLVLTGTAFTIFSPTTPNAFDPTPNGGGDAFLARIALLAVGCERFGAPTPGCAGGAVPGTRAAPQVGNTDFAVTCTAAQAGASGSLFFALAPAASPVNVLGIDLWVDVSTVFASIPVSADPHGGATLSLAIANDPGLAGQSFATQFVWIDPCGAFGLASSSGLMLEVQP